MTRAEFDQIVRKKNREFKITYLDVGWHYIRKSLYLIPIVIVAYPFAVIYEGIKEIGTLGLDSIFTRYKENKKYYQEMLDSLKD